MNDDSIPLVSVIIPAFNRAGVVGEAIASVLEQTYERCEVVVIDDGSTDDTAEVARAFDAARVRVLVRENGGIGAARNTGIEHAEGPFLAFLDSDDRWAPDKVERQVAALVADPGLDGVYGFVKEFGEGAQGPGRARDARSPLPSATLVRRGSFDRVGPFATNWRVGEWIEWWARASDLGLRFEAVADAVTYRRVDGDNQGFREVERRGDYVQILKEALDRRRAQAPSGPTAEGPA